MEANIEVVMHPGNIAENMKAIINSLTAKLFRAFEKPEVLTYAPESHWMRIHGYNLNILITTKYTIIDDVIIVTFHDGLDYRIAEASYNKTENTINSYVQIPRLIQFISEDKNRRQYVRSNSEVMANDD